MRVSITSRELQRPARVRSRPLLFLATVLLVSVSLSARDKITVTYAKGLDFSKLKSYAWADHGAVAHPMLAADIVGAIEQELNNRGLQKVGANPDLIIKVYGSIDDEQTLYSNDPLYMGSGGIPPFDPSMTGPATIGMYGNTTVTIHKGELIVDLVDPAAKKLAWRGIAQEAVSAHDPDKLMQEVNDSISKMFQKYPIPKP